MRLYSCSEHIDEALDEVVDQDELAPIMEKVEDTNNLSTGCFMCGSEATYLVSTEY
jgi:CxxH/CxxC protein (TIGR04129 family)